MAARHSRMGANGIDLPLSYPGKGNESRNAQDRGDVEHAFLGEEIAAGTHSGSGKTVADREEAHIAAEPFADPFMPDEAEADRDDCGAEHAACRGVQDVRREHDGKDGHQGECQGAHADEDKGHRGDAPLRARRVHQGSARYLPDECDEPPDREHETDVHLGPFIGSEVDGDERAKARLNVGNEEGEPIEPAQTFARGPRGLPRLDRRARGERRIAFSAIASLGGRSSHAVGRLVSNYLSGVVGAGLGSAFSWTGGSIFGSSIVIWSAGLYSWDPTTSSRVRSRMMRMVFPPDTK